MVYLGLPLGANMRLAKSWDPVIQKFHSRLHSWKGRFLSFAGRLELLKSVLSSLPLFYLSMFTIPVLVAKKLVRIQRTCLWGGTTITKKLCLIAWAKIAKPKEHGGLGVENLLLKNQSLLFKWL
ncbi:hypothetical protein Tsubulata_002464 [Turnera subulata]|uniref:Reverse transcriptase zinc-binding domain-containing protein n=1 Tax=Turnera subulata TaxID=218843 RepID=A0A9Q0F8X9_9ROSI|nr:hypothetical protein Tsubulata_002464 [Turnera subulata]